MKIIVKKQQKAKKGFKKQKFNFKEYKSFWKSLFVAMVLSESKEKVINQLLNENIHLIDKELSNSLESCINYFLYKGFDRKTLCSIVNDLMVSIARFPSSEEVVNHQISSAMYRIAIKKKLATEDSYEYKALNLNFSDILCKTEGDYLENIELAIEVCNKALKNCSNEVCPDVWKAGNSNLAGLYTKRRKGDRSQNLEQAIQIYQSLLISVSCGGDTNS